MKKLGLIAVVGSPGLPSGSMQVYTCTCRRVDVVTANIPSSPMAATSTLGLPFCVKMCAKKSRSPTVFPDSLPTCELSLALVSRYRYMVLLMPETNKNESAWWESVATPWEIEQPSWLARVFNGFGVVAVLSLVGSQTGVMTSPW